MTSALDEAVIAQLLESVGGDPEFLAELIDDVVKDGPIQLESLRQTADSGDAAGARRAAHTLKSHGRTFGALELASACEVAEAAARSGDLDTVLTCLPGLEAEWGRVQFALLAARDGET